MTNTQPQASSPSTHCCPRCGKPLVCDLERGETNCWCFELPRSTSSPILSTADRCLCRDCLNARQPAEIQPPATDCENA